MRFVHDLVPIDSDPKSQLGSLGSQSDFQLLHNLMHLHHYVLSKASHVDGMFRYEFWKTTDSNITVSNRFNLEDFVSTTSFIKRVIEGFQQEENLRWLPDTCPCL